MESARKATMPSLFGEQAGRPGFQFAEMQMVPEKNCHDGKEYAEKNVSHIVLQNREPGVPDMPVFVSP